MGIKQACKLPNSQTHSW